MGLTIRPIDAPDFRASAQILDNAGKALDRGLSGFQVGLARYAAQNQESQSNAVLTDLAGVQNEKGFDAFLKNLNIQPQDISPELKKAMMNARTNALNYEGKRASTASTASASARASAAAAQEKERNRQLSEVAVYGLDQQYRGSQAGAGDPNDLNAGADGKTGGGKYSGNGGGTPLPIDSPEYVRGIINKVASKNNGVSALTGDDVKDIYTGQIASFRDQQTASDGNRKADLANSATQITNSGLELDNTKAEQEIRQIEYSFGRDVNSNRRSDAAIKETNRLDMVATEGSEFADQYPDTDAAMSALVNDDTFRARPVEDQEAFIRGVNGANAARDYVNPRIEVPVAASLTRQATEAFETGKAQAAQSISGDPSTGVIKVLNSTYSDGVDSRAALVSRLSSSGITDAEGQVASQIDEIRSKLNAENISVSDQQIAALIDQTIIQGRKGVPFDGQNYTTIRSDNADRIVALGRATFSSAAIRDRTERDQAGERDRIEYERLLQKNDLAAADYSKAVTQGDSEGIARAKANFAAIGQQIQAAETARNAEATAAQKLIDQALAKSEAAFVATQQADATARVELINEGLEFLKKLNDPQVERTIAELQRGEISLDQAMIYINNKIPVGEREAVREWMIYQGKK